MSVFFLTFSIFAGVVLFNKPLSNLIRATEEVAPSGENSLIIAWPLTTNADGIATAEISVFVRSTTGKPVANKVVTLSSSLGTLKESSVVTDKEGKATFTLTSLQKGIAEVSATADNTPITQKVSIKFE